MMFLLVLHHNNSWKLQVKVPEKESILKNWNWIQDENATKSSKLAKSIDRGVGSY